MEVTKRILYDVEKSASRIDEILDASNSNYADKTSIPSRDSLTYTNGYYVNLMFLGILFLVPVYILTTIVIMILYFNRKKKIKIQVWCYITLGFFDNGNIYW